MSSAFDRLYEDYHTRKSNQRKRESLENTRKSWDMFSPNRVSKEKDKKYKLDREPFYQKFNRLYNDHEEKLKRQRKAQENQNQEIDNTHTYAWKSINRNSSVNSSKSLGRRLSLTSKIFSPEEAKRKQNTLIQKINKEEGVTFRPKINNRRSVLQLTKSLNTTEWNPNIDNSTRSSENICFNNQIAKLASKRSCPSICKYKKSTWQKENKGDYYYSENNRYNNEPFTYSKITNFEEDTENISKSIVFNGSVISIKINIIIEQYYMKYKN